MFKISSAISIIDNWCQHKQKLSQHLTSVVKKNHWCKFQLNIMSTATLEIKRQRLISGQKDLSKLQHMCRRRSFWLQRVSKEIWITRTKFNENLTKHVGVIKRFLMGGELTLEFPPSCTKNCFHWHAKKIIEMGE